MSDLTASARAFHADSIREPTPVPEPLTGRERRRLTGRALEDRLAQEVAYLSRLTVYSPAQREAMRWLDQRLADVSTCDPESMPMLWMRGLSAAGKSRSIVDSMARHYRRLLLIEPVSRGGPTELPVWKIAGLVADWIPFVRLDFYLTDSKRGPMWQYLEFLGYGLDRHSSRLQERLLLYSERHGVRVVVIDNIQNLALHRKDAQLFLQQLRSLNHQLSLGRVLVVFLDTPRSAYSKLGPQSRDTGPSIADDDQLANRLERLEFTDFTFDTEADPDKPSRKNSSFLAWLSEWERALQHVLPELHTGLLTDYLPLTIYLNSAGLTGHIAGTLKTAARTALEVGAMTIQPSHVKAYRSAKVDQWLVGHMQKEAGLHPTLVARMKRVGAL